MRRAGVWWRRCRRDRLEASDPGLRKFHTSSSLRWTATDRTNDRWSRTKCRGRGGGGHRGGGGDGHTQLLLLRHIFSLPSCIPRLSYRLAGWRRWVIGVHLPVRILPGCTYRGVSGGAGLGDCPWRPSQLMSPRWLHNLPPNTMQSIRYLRSAPCCNRSSGESYEVYLDMLLQVLNSYSIRQTASCVFAACLLHV